jgi:hypothetical protein
MFLGLISGLFLQNYTPPALGRYFRLLFVLTFCNLVFSGTRIGLSKLLILSRYLRTLGDRRSFELGWFFAYSGVIRNLIRLSGMEFDVGKQTQSNKLSHSRRCMSCCLPSQRLTGQMLGFLRLRRHLTRRCEMCHVRSHEVRKGQVLRHFGN